MPLLLTWSWYSQWSDEKYDENNDCVINFGCCIGIDKYFLPGYHYIVKKYRWNRMIKYQK